MESSVRSSRSKGPHSTSVQRFHLDFFLKKFPSSMLPSFQKRSVYRPLGSQIDSQLDIHQSSDRLLGMTMPTYHGTVILLSRPAALYKLLSQQPASQTPFVKRTASVDHHHRFATVDHSRQLCSITRAVQIRNYCLWNMVCYCITIFISDRVVALSRYGHV